MRQSALRECAMFVASTSPAPVPAFMEHASIVRRLDQALRAAASPTAAQSLQRYFPAPVAALGVSNAAVGAIAVQAVRDATFNSETWLDVADHFARSHAVHEQLILASALAAQVAKRAEGERLFSLVESWLAHDVNNWAQCDDLCIKPLYLWLKRHPQFVDRVDAWGLSPSPWLRRASNVALVKFVGRSSHVDLARVFANCARLLGDSDPYVQTGIGWVLKVAGQHAPDAVVHFIVTHAATMERVTLRYAVEKLEPDRRRDLMRATRTL